MGWGKTDNAATISPVLKQMTTIIIIFIIIIIIFIIIIIIITIDDLVLITIVTMSIILMLLKVLNQLNVDLISNDKCRKSYGDIIRETNLCAQVPLSSSQF